MSDDDKDVECDCYDEFLDKQKDMSIDEYKRLTELFKARIRELNKAVDVLRKEIIVVAQSTQTVYVYCEDCKPKVTKVKFADIVDGRGNPQTH